MIERINNKDISNKFLLHYLKCAAVMSQYEINDLMSFMKSNKKLFEDAHFSKFLYFQIILKNRGLCFDKKFLDNMAVGALNSLYKFLLGKNKALTQKDDNYYCKNFELFERLSANIDVKILQKIKYVPKLDHWKELEILEA